MGRVIELRAKQSNLRSVPVDLFALRWRIRLMNGVEITSSFLPEFRYPSIRETMRDYADQVDRLFIDGKHRFTGVLQTFLECPGDSLLDWTFKGISGGGRNINAVIGIEVRDREGNSYLMLRDGNAHIEEKNHVANDN